MTVEFFVPGVPAPGGSKKPVRNRKTGKTVLIDDCKRNGSWRAVVALYGRHAMKSRPLLDGPLRVTMAFRMPRPAGHYGTGRNAGRLKPSAPEFPTVKPDVLKLARSTEDALTGAVWVDDNRTITLTLVKEYAYRNESPGVLITVEPIPVKVAA